MSSSSILLRSHGFNTGEEPFLAPGVGMLTGMTCSASCVHCYLADGSPEPREIGLPEWRGIIRDFAARQASCLFLVNWEGIEPTVARRFLQVARREVPHVPVVLKLGGHEDPSWVQGLLDLVAAVSLDVKVCSPVAATQVLGNPRYPDRCRDLLALVVDVLGIFDPLRPDLRGVWLRHVILPSEAATWPEQLVELVGSCVPLWVLTGYRPFGRARRIEALNRRLSAEERRKAGQVVARWRQEGKTVWLT